MAEPIEVVITPEKYVISSCGYDGSVNNIPGWLTDLIEDGVSDGLVPVITDMNNAQTWLDSLQIGVNSNTVKIDTAELSLNARIDTVASRLDGNIAGIEQTLLTYVTEDEAYAEMDTKIAATFTDGTVESAAWFQENIAAHADATSANATSISNLVANFEDIEVRIDDHDETFAGISTTWNGVGLPDIGMTQEIELDPIGAPGELTSYIYVGGTLGPNNDGWLVGGTGGVAGWAAYASKLIVGPDGDITGWEFGDGTLASSEFKISADKIIMNGTTTFVATGDNISSLNNDSGFTNDDAANAAALDAYNASLAAAEANTAASTAQSNASAASVAAYNAQITANSKYSYSDVASVLNNNTTVINGSQILTGKISAAYIETDQLTVNTLNIGGSDSGAHYTLYISPVDYGGIYASGSSIGVKGYVNNTSGYGVQGYCFGSNGVGVYGSGGKYGVYGSSTASGGHGVYGASSSGMGVYCSGNMQTTGKLYIGSNGCYLIATTHNGNPWTGIYIPHTGQVWPIATI